MKTDTTKRTPGPWETDFTRNYNAHDVIRHNGVIIAVLPTSITHKQGERYANAQFIIESANNYERVKAERDELAAVLKTAQETICMVHCGATGPRSKNMGGKHVKVCNIARAALAKLEAK